MQTRRILAPLAAAALLTTAVLGAGVANAEGSSSGSLGSLDLGSLEALGLPNLEVSIEYKCVASETATAKTAHVLTKVTNTGGTTANNVSTFTTVSGGGASAQNAATVAPGETVTYDLDTKTAALAAGPVFALVYSTGLDANPFNNVAISTAPAVCDAQ